MDALFWVKCSADLARRLGAVPRKRVPGYQALSFPVYETVKTHYAHLFTEEGHFAWLWKIDRDHPTIEVL